MKTRKYLSFFIVLALILTALVGCGKEGSKVETDAQPEENGEENVAEEIDSEQYLNLLLSAEPSTLDPSKGADSYSNSILNNVMEPLTRLEEDEDLNNFVAPAGAEDWEYNEDGTVWTFKIRDAKWSDGEPVRAQDYEYGIKRSIAQDTASPYAYLLNPIKNAAKANSGEVSIDEVGVKALDDKTLEITLEGPTPHFLSLTYQRVMLPQREDIVEKYGDQYGSEVDAIVYNGPFILSTWVHNSELILTKNENYWDKDTVKLENINLKIIQDENAVYNSLANGSIDLAGANKPEWKEKFMKDDRLDHQEVVNPQTFFIFFNTQDEVFKNANVRKAFSIAINREELANVIFHGVHMPAYGWVAPSISIGDDEYRTVVEGPVKKLIDENSDPKALLSKGLEELGMDPDPANLTVKIAFGSTDQWFRTYGEYLQEMYNKLLGVNIEVEMYEWPVFNAAVEKGDFQVSYMAWGAEYNDPFSMLSLLRSDANAIGTGWVNEEYDELIDLAAKEMDQAKRLEYFEEAEKILLYDEAVLAPVVYPRGNIFSYKYVHDLGVTPFETQGYKYGYTQGR
jgi:oligopeptide transport system substrate-binding protein